MSLSMRQKMAIWETGRCRCPHCGNFRRPVDFPDQPARHNFDGPGFVGLISVPPQCSNCLPDSAQISRLSTHSDGYEANETENLAMDPRSRLIKLAARILTDSVHPSTYIEEHAHRPKRLPVRWWRWLCSRMVDGEEERKSWARELRQIADSLPDNAEDLCECRSLSG